MSKPTKETLLNEALDLREECRRLRNEADELESRADRLEAQVRTAPTATSLIADDIADLVQATAGAALSWFEMEVIDRAKAGLDLTREEANRLLILGREHLNRHLELA